MDENWSADPSIRMKAVLQEKTEGSRRFKMLEEKTKIPATNWTNWYHGRQRATQEMIQALSRLYPEYAFWIATGITDWTHGHTCPAHAVAAPNTMKFKHPAAKSYFESKLAEINMSSAELDWHDNELTTEAIFIDQYNRNLEHANLIKIYIAKEKLRYEMLFSSKWSGHFDANESAEKYNDDKEI